MSSDNLTWPPQTTAQDHLVVAVVWSELEQLLNGQAGPSDMFLGRLQGMLPPLEPIPAQQLPSIARIHLQSAAHIKATMCMLARAAFPGGEHSYSSGDHGQHSGLAPVHQFVPERLPAAAEAMIVKLIDLQVFHLHRVQEVTTHLRRHARARAQDAQARAQEQEQEQAGAAATAAAAGVAAAER